MDRSEANHFIDELLETSAIAFGVRDRRSPHIWFLIGEQKEVAHYIATETGGQYFEATPDTYSRALQEILLQLHFRYELGFKPEMLDGKRHELRVTLADAAKIQHREVRLRYRTAYVLGGNAIRRLGSLHQQLQLVNWRCFGRRRTGRHGLLNLPRSTVTDAFGKTHTVPPPALREVPAGAWSGSA